MHHHVVLFSPSSLLPRRHCCASPTTRIRQLMRRWSAHGQPDEVIASSTDRIHESSSDHTDAGRHPGCRPQRFPGFAAQYGCDEPQRLYSVPPVSTASSAAHREGQSRCTRKGHASGASPTLRDRRMTLSTVSPPDEERPSEIQGRDLACVGNGSVDCEHGPDHSYSSARRQVG